MPQQNWVRFVVRCIAANWGVGYFFGGFRHRIPGRRRSRSAPPILSCALRVVGGRARPQKAWPEPKKDRILIRKGRSGLSNNSLRIVLAVCAATLSGFHCQPLRWPGGGEEIGPTKRGKGLKIIAGMLADFEQRHAEAEKAGSVVTVQPKIGNAGIDGR